jgi:hypothetical protein
MRLPSVGWAVLSGLAVLILAAYVLDRGIFIGSEVQSELADICRSRRPARICSRGPPPLPTPRFFGLTGHSSNSHLTR